LLQTFLNSQRGQEPKRAQNSPGKSQNIPEANPPDPSFNSYMRTAYVHLLKMKWLYASML